MKFWDNVGELVISNFLASSSIAYFVQKTFTIKSQSRRKTE